MQFPLQYLYALAVFGPVTCSGGRSEALFKPVKDATGPLSGFPTYKQSNDLLSAWVEENPSLLKKVSIGKSFEGRDLYAYVLAMIAAPPALERPQVLLTSLIHPREPATLSVVLFFLGHILELVHQGDPNAVYLVENREVWIVPFINPDGYIANEGRPLNRRDVRKNMRPTCPSRPAGNGVDLNANFGFHWRAGEFPPCDEAYSGTTPFSEPETQAIRKLVEDNHFKVAVNFHSYGGMLLYPFHWAVRKSDAELPPADKKIYKEIASNFGWPKQGSVYTNLGYSANGEAEDWMYGVKGIIAMAPEIGPESGGFWPRASVIPGINRRNFKRIRHAVNKAGLQPTFEVLAQAEGSSDHATYAMEIGNSGLAATPSKVLFAVEVTRTDGVMFGLADVILGGLAEGEVTQSLAAGGKAYVWASLQPLERRSSRTFSLRASSQDLLPGELARVAPIKARICFFEPSPGEKKTTICQCLEKGTQGAIQGATFADAKDDLCNLAAEQKAPKDAVGGNPVMMPPSAGSGTVRPPVTPPVDQTLAPQVIPVVPHAKTLVKQVANLTKGKADAAQLFPGLGGSAAILAVSVGLFCGLGMAFVFVCCRRQRRPTSSPRAQTPPKDVESAVGIGRRVGPAGGVGPLE